MKRSTTATVVRVLLVTAIGLSLLPSIADSSFGRQRPRTERRTYVGAQPTQATPCPSSPSAGCVILETRRRDSSVRVTVADRSRTGPVLAYVIEDLEGNGVADDYDNVLAGFCGTSRRIRLDRPGKDLLVSVHEVKAGLNWTYTLPPLAVPYVDQCSGGGVATTGTVTATFWR